MGYYSEVAICMAFEDNDKRDAFWELISLRKDEVGEVMRNKCAKDDRMPWITYHDSSIKWYESHPTVQAFEDVLFDLVRECGGAWRILRIGEDQEDIEDKSDCDDYQKVDVPWDAFYLNRSISWG